MALVSIEISGGIAVVTIDNPPVNALGHGVRAGLDQAVTALDENPDVRAVVLACAGGTFIAGADVREFDQVAQPPHLPELVLRIEAAVKPWVAAIHGTALGGGLEVALACKYRLANEGARLGLPEVHLGLIPGAGGTVRLPRLVGPEAALEMISGGRMVGAVRAAEIGLVDRVVTGDLVAAAVAFAGEIADLDRVALIDMPMEAPGDAGAWEAKKAGIAAKARGQNSPLVAIESVENAIALPAPDALDEERKLFVALKATPQSAALRRVFFAERAVGKIAGLKGVAARDLGEIGVIGGGTMGAGIAAACLLAGLKVVMVERDSESAAAGLERVQGVLAGSHRRGLIDDAQLASLQAAFVATPDYTGLAEADLIIEAVFEEMAIKQEVFARLEDVVRADAVLATNTSYLDVGEIAAGLKEPSRLLGLHFFSPAHIMKLLEVVRPPAVADDVLATGLALAKRLGKVAVPSGVCDGFIANRMMSSYRREADYMVADGAWPQDVDRAMVEFGFPMGIFAMQDLAGLDIGWAARKRRAGARDPAERYVKIADRICEVGRLGRKTGAGWYDYSADANGVPDPAIEAIIRAESESEGITRKAFSQDQIMERILSVMQIEGRAILDEGIAQSAEAIDVVMINGYGFPRWRGGPMHMLG